MFELVQSNTAVATTQADTAHADVARARSRVLDRALAVASWPLQKSTQTYVLVHTAVQLLQCQTPRWNVTLIFDQHLASAVGL
jgi:hypothetical protein